MNCKQERYDCAFCRDNLGCSLLTDTRYYKMCPFYVSEKQLEEERTEISRFICDRKYVGESNAKLRLTEIRKKWGNPNRK